MKKAKLIIILILAVLTGIIILQNLDSIDTRVLFITITMPRALFLALTWLVGLICGVLIPLQWKSKK